MKKFPVQNQLTKPTPKTIELEIWKLIR
uniref:Uncharacterized protein n=1 Tax=Rhizophora mucronata TaxID=61149 RepID=A0A2P2PTX6_RHIMU